MPQLITVVNNNPSGAGSLADAIAIANSDPGSTIQFDPSVTGTIDITGTLSITANVTINGPGASVLTVRRDPLALASFPVFNVANNVSFAISGLTISNGLSNVGAGLFLANGATYNLNDMAFTGNRLTGVSPIGGTGLFAAINTSGTISNSLFRDNKNLPSGPSPLLGRGGGILNRGIMTLDTVTFDDNNSGAGGGLANEETVTASFGTFTLNEAINPNGNGGGAILNFGTGSFDTTLVNGNDSVSVGGGISNLGTLDFSQSTVSENHAISVGAGFSTSGSLDISATSIYRNVTDEATGGAGVDIASNVPVNFTNSTLTENVSADVNNYSIVNIGGDVLILSSTISNPSLTETIVNISTGTYTFANTVINATNGPSGDFISLGGNFVGGDPQLKPLANYGGPTETMEPAPGSPLINNGDITFVAAIPTDQRGFPRVSGGNVDIGSVEVQSAPICYSGESLILAQIISTGDIAEIKAKNIYAGVHRVYDLKRNKFIPVKHNIVTGPVERFMRIEKNALGEDMPTSDFLVTGGHKLLVRGEIIKASKIPEAKRMKVKPSMVYSICTEKKGFLFINGLTVLSWGEQEWAEHSKKYNIGWTDNKPANISKNLEN